MLKAVEYRSGYLLPVEPVKGKFNSQRDRTLIAEGTHFFCRACLTAVIIEERSKNPDYCVACLAVFRA